MPEKEKEKKEEKNSVRSKRVHAPVGATSLSSRSIVRGGVLTIRMRARR